MECTSCDREFSELYDDERDTHGAVLCPECRAEEIGNMLAQSARNSQLERERETLERRVKELEAENERLRRALKPTRVPVRTRAWIYKSDPNDEPPQL